MLANLAPVALMGNPVLPLLPLEVPDFAARAPTILRRVLLKRADTPANLLKLFVLRNGAEEVRTEARLHVRFHGELPDDNWQADIEWVLRQAARRLRTEPVRTVAFELSELGLAPDWLIDEKPLADPLDQDADLLDLVVGEFTPAPLCPVANIADGSEGALALLLDWVGPETEEQGEYMDEDEEDLIGEAPRCTLPPYAPDALVDPHILLLRHASGGRSERERRGIQWTLAYHPNTPPDCLRVVAGNSDPYLRRVACRHPNAPEDMQELCRQTLLRTLQEGICREERALPWLLRLFLLLARPETSELRLREGGELARDATDWEHRLVASLTLPTFPPGRALLKQLAQEDGNCLVRVAARARLRGEIFDLTN